MPRRTGHHTQLSMSSIQTGTGGPDWTSSGIELERKCERRTAESRIPSRPSHTSAVASTTHHTQCQPLSRPSLALKKGPLAVSSGNWGARCPQRRWTTRAGHCRTSCGTVRCGEATRRTQHSAYRAREGMYMHSKNHGDSSRIHRLMHTCVHAEGCTIRMESPDFASLDPYIYKSISKKFMGGRLAQFV